MRRHGNLFAVIVIGSALVLSMIPCALSMIPCALAASGASDVATNDEYGGREELSSEGMVAVTGDELAEGTYDIIVETDTQMFNIVDCKLTVSGDAMSASITLSSDGYKWVYMGTGAEASKADEDDYVDYTLDDEGRYVFDIGQIEALNFDVSCCCFSKRRQKWYDHTIIFLAASLPSAALSETAHQAVNDSSIIKDLVDGTYSITCDISGGDDELESPTTMVIADGSASVTCTFSSTDYTSISICGESFEPTSTDGEKAVFELPVDIFDTTIPATIERASTSEALETSLSFHSGKITLMSAAGSLSAEFIAAIIAFVVLVLVVVVIVVVVVIRRRKFLSKDLDKSS